MITETLDRMIKEEIDKGTEAFHEEYEHTKDQLQKYKNKYIEMSNEVNQMIKLKNQLDEFRVFQQLINKGNIEEIIQHLNLHTIEIDFLGMNSEYIPVWFKLLCTHYKDKGKLFTLFDMFSIEYPTWAKTFKIPSDYGDIELDLIFDKLGKMYVCNNEIFSNNMGFFWQYQNKFRGNLNELFSRESYVEIPWNLLLQNKLLTTEKYFAKIINSLSNKQSHSEYFFMIQSYQDLSEDQVNKMAEYLPTKNFHSYHNFFMEKNKGIFKQREDLAKLLKHKMSDYERSPFYYLNYPLVMQKEFVLSNSDRHSGYGFELVEKMNIPNKEKLKLMNKVATRLLDKTE